MSISGERNYIPFVPLPPKIRSTRRQLNRLWVLAIVTSSVLLTFLVIPNGFSTAQSITQQVVLKLMPTPAPALPPGYDSFYIDKDIPWAKVFVDGHQMHLPRIGVDEPLKLGRGHHLISWRADPFLPQSCLLSIPFGIDRQDCRQLCSARWKFRLQETAASVASGWFTLAMTRSSWDYATENGRIVARNQPVSLLGPAPGQQLLLLRIAWDHGWHVNVLLGPDLGPPIYTNTKSKGVNGKYERFLTGSVQVADDPACNVARLFVIRGLAVGPQVGESTLAMIRLVSSSNPAIGCLVIVNSTDETGKTPAAILSPAYYIVRFGLLLTANTVAYLIRPWGPRAHAYELSLVKQLATLPGQAFTDVVGRY